MHSIFHKSYSDCINRNDAGSDVRILTEQGRGDASEVGTICRLYLKDDVYFYLRSIKGCVVTSSASDRKVNSFTLVRSMKG